MRLTADLLDALCRVAEAEGMLRLSAVRLDHPGFAPARAALAQYVAQGRHGEMEFVARTLAVRSDPAQMLPDARSVLVALVPYDGEPGPIARYARPLDYHTVMHQRLEVVADHLRERLPQTQTLVCVDTKPVLERAAAVLAGLGFLGKNGMLIAPGLGSQVLIGAILCTAEVEHEAEIDLARVRWDACGSCTRCLDACPTQAFDAPGRLDPRRCVSYLTIEHRGPIDDALADAAGERVAGCDVCQDVCPYNAGKSRTAKIPAAAWLPLPPSPRSADLADIVELGSSRYRAFVRDTALRRIPRRSLRRNALIALGNRSAALTDRERAAIDRALTDDDPQIRGAARRALAKHAAR